MSLDVSLAALRHACVYDGNITHNLVRMAEEAGIYHYLWRPEEVGIYRAEQLIEPLARGLDFLESNPEHFRQFDAPNGWGKYENLVAFVRGYLAACRDNPDADVSASR